MSRAAREYSLRHVLADVAALRWARVRGIDLAIPAGLAIVAAGLAGQLGRPIAGLPFGAWWIGVSATALAAWAAVAHMGRTAPLRPVVLLAVPVVASWLLFDILLWQQSDHLYDLNVYLGSCGRWLDGGQAYMTAPIASWPENAAADFFLYPPPLLPVFGLLSRLPNPIVSSRLDRVPGGVCRSPPSGCSACAGLEPAAAGLPAGHDRDRIGQRRRLTLLLFALAYRAGGAWSLDGLFKTPERSAGAVAAAREALAARLASAQRP